LLLHEFDHFFSVTLSACHNALPLKVVAYLLMKTKRFVRVCDTQKSAIVVVGAKEVAAQVARNRIYFRNCHSSCELPMNTHTQHFRTPIGLITIFRSCALQI
jgi:hypothetical protein